MHERLSRRLRLWSRLARRALDLTACSETRVPAAAGEAQVVFRHYL